MEAIRHSGDGEVDYGFGSVARRIVGRVRNEMLDQYPGPISNAVKKLNLAQIDKISADIEKAFLGGRANMHSLERTAFKSLAIAAVRGTSKRYSIKAVGDIISPEEYFERVYKDKFIELGLPINSIGSIDPNLHTRLRKEAKFPIVSRMLANG